MNIISKLKSTLSLNTEYIEEPNQNVKTEYNDQKTQWVSLVAD